MTPAASGTFGGNKVQCNSSRIEYLSKGRDVLGGWEISSVHTHLGRKILDVEHRRCEGTIHKLAMHTHSTAAQTARRVKRDKTGGGGTINQVIQCSGRYHHVKVGYDLGDHHVQLADLWISTLSVRSEQS